MLTNKFRKKLERAIVRIKVESIELNWEMPFQLDKIGSGHGSGFFIDSTHIITCSHVVDTSKNIYIEIPSLGSDKIEVKVIGICPRFDIALLKTVNYKSKDYLKLGSCKNLNLGDEIFVVGYPVSLVQEGVNDNFNLKYTKGIVSGTQLSLIQVTANINPGVSGSCLLNGDKVVGINSQKLVGDNIEGVGYSVPIDFYKVIEKEFKKNEKTSGFNKPTIIRRPSLAFEYSNSNKSLFEYISNNHIDEGIYISKLYKDSPLKELGMKEGDVITKINKRKIDNFGMVDFDWLQTKLDIYTYLNHFSIHDKIQFEYYRNEKKINKIMTLKPFIQPIRLKYPLYENVDYMIFSGMVFMDLSLNHIKNDPEKFLKYLNPEEQQESKLLCSFVFPNTPMFILKNIRKGDVIKKINNHHVKNLDDLRKNIQNPLIHKKKEYIKIETEDGQISMIDLKNSIVQDMVFSDIYKYDLSNFHQKEIKKMSKSDLEKDIYSFIHVAKKN